MRRCRHREKIPGVGSPQLDAIRGELPVEGHAKSCVVDVF